MVDEFPQGAHAKMALGNPADHLYVPQAAGVFLNIGFQIVGGVVILAVTLDLFVQLGLEKGF